MLRVVFKLIGLSSFFLNVAECALIAKFVVTRRETSVWVASWVHNFAFSPHLMLLWIINDLASSLLVHGHFIRLIIANYSWNLTVSDQNVVIGVFGVFILFSLKVPIDVKVLGDRLFGCFIEVSRLSRSDEFANFEGIKGHGLLEKILGRIVVKFSLEFVTAIPELVAVRVTVGLIAQVAWIVCICRVIGRDAIVWVFIA